MYIFWALAGIMFLFCEFKKNSPLLLAFAYDSLFCATAVYKFNVVFKYQMLLFLGFFGLFYFLITTIYKKDEDEKKSLELLNDIQNCIVTVKKDIGRTFSIDGIGLVEYQNTLFKAKNIVDKKIEAGKKVKVVSRENLILNVKILEDDIKYAKH